MATPAAAIDKIQALFDRNPCWMIQPLGQALQYSVASVRRFLARIGYFSSFTHNGRWYTLARIPRFSREGLWFYQDIGFSAAGSLTATLVALTEASPGGLSAEALGQKLHCRCHSVLVHLVRRGHLQRRRVGRSHVYLAADPQAADAQLQAAKPPEPAVLPAEIAVLVLAEFIRRPKMQPGQLAKAVSAKTGLCIQDAQVRALFERHDLKKTSRLPSGF